MNTFLVVLSRYFFSLINLEEYLYFQGYLEETILDPSKKHELLGDSVAWAGCTIIYLLGQQQHFELFDFSYQFLNVAEVESMTVSQSLSSERARSANYLQVGTLHANVTSASYKLFVL